jgi:hypothetical protein
MSSRKAATAKNGTKNGTKARTKAAPRAAAPVKSAPAPAARATSVSAAAEQVAADIQRALKSGDHEVLSSQSLQKLMTAACRLYSAQVEAGSQALPVGEVTPTDIMVTASGMMRAGNLAVFELGMWQSWTGR